MEYLIGMMECISQWKHLAFKFSKQVGTTIVLGKMCAHYKFVIIIIIINNELHNKYHTIATAFITGNTKIHTLYKIGKKKLTSFM